MSDETAYGDYEAEYARVEAIGRLIDRPVYDDDAGPYIRLIERADGNDVIAFVPDADEVDQSTEGWDRWRIQDDEHGEIALSTDLTLDSAAEDVAAWPRALDVAVPPLTRTHPKTRREWQVVA